MNYSLRPFHPDELTALVDLMNRSYADFGTDSSVRPDHVKLWLEDPNYELHVLTNAEGTLIGSVSFSYEVEAGTSWGEFVIEPGYRRDDVIAALLAHAEARTLARAGEQSPLDVRFSINRTAEDVIGVFQTSGYDYIRSSYRMHIALDAPVEAPIPDGIAIRPFDRERDARAAHATFEDSFSEHWGFTRETYEEWEKNTLNFPGHDQSLWLIAWEGDQLVGFSFNRALASKPRAVWVGDLGVLKTHRKRGIGEALLKCSFKLFQERGLTWAGLGVDASNATGALRLYERAGMSVYLEFLNYRKVLRAASAPSPD